MNLNWNTLIITVIVVFSLISSLTAHVQWGILAGLIIGVGGAKWLRLQKKDAKDEIEYDERVNENIKRFSFETFSFTNLLLLVYLLFSLLVLERPTIATDSIILYICLTFLIAYYIVPFIARRR